MVISEELLFQYGAFIKHYAKNETIFNEGNFSKNYYQIHEGTVKISNKFDDGREFVHGFPFKGHCFGESYLNIDLPYGVNANALTNCTVIILPKNAYLELILNNTHALMEVNKYTAERQHFRYLISSFLAIKNPLLKIEKLLTHLKNYFGYSEPYSFQVPYTRYQLSCLTGLRVETTIRVIKKMEALNLIKICDNKVYF